MEKGNLNDLLKNDLMNNDVPMLVGKPGTGLVTQVQELIKDELKAHYFGVSCLQLATINDLTRAVMHATLYAAGQTGEITVLILDGIDHANSDITTAVLSLASKRKIENVTLPDNMRIVMVCGINEYDRVAELFHDDDNFIVYKIES
jgi:hypothetical protein